MEPLRRTAQSFQPPIQPSFGIPVASTPAADAPLRSIPVIDLDSLIERKLRDPRLVLSAEESIALLSGCIERGEKEAEKALGKELCVVIGNTGAGKSTFANSLFGCTMKRVRPQAVAGARSLQNLVVVQPRSDGGALDEVMPIGHTTNSQTFIPQIETVGITLCDCPGFLDNRGYQLNVANAANIKNVFIRATGIKVVILINYHSLLADRAAGLSAMIRICCDLFGSKENLIQFQNSILLGVTQIPRLVPDDEQRLLQELKEFIAETELRDEFEQSTVRVMAQHLFIYDPLDADLEYAGALKKAEVLEAINTLELIREPQSIFKTVLTPEDIAGLMGICDETQSRITTLLNRGDPTEEDFIQIAHYQTGLHRLNVIEHPRILQLLAHTRAVITRHFNQMVQRFDRCCCDESFRLAAEAESILEAIRVGIQHFDEEIRSDVHLEELRQRYDLLLKKREARAIVIELNDLERRYRDECAEQNMPGAQETLETIKQKIRFFESEYALTGVNHRIELNDLEKLYVKTSLRRELFDLQNQFMLSCRNRRFQEAKETLEGIKQKRNCLITEHRISEGALNINVSELEFSYNRGVETEIEELTLQFRTKCHEKNIGAASELLDSLRPRMMSFYDEQKFVQEISELEEILRIAIDKLSDKLNRLFTLQDTFYNQCNNRDIPQAESSLNRIKEKVHTYDDKYRHLDPSASGLINIASLEQYLENNALSTFSSDDHQSKSQITDDELSVFVQRNPRLTSVDLQNCSNITDAGLLALSQGCPRLTSLNLSSCAQITDRGLTALAQTCRGLTNLNLSGCQRITGSGLTTLAQSCPGLTNLNLSVLRITDSGLTALAQACHGMASLNLNYCTQITNNGLIGLAQNCPGLTNLNLNHFTEITDTGLAALAQLCPGLTRLNLFRCRLITDTGLTALARTCRGLTSLNLPFSRQITDSGLMALAQSCPGLTSLNLNSCTEITDIGLTALAQSCPGLISLDLSCTLITGRGLITLVQRCPGVTSLSLAGCSQITDSDLTVLAPACPGLANLNLYGCSQITDRGLIALAQACLGLTQLGLSQCTQITDRGLITLAQRCPGLTNLKLAGCRQTTDRGLIALAQACPGLISLDLLNCAQITDSGLTALAQACRSLTSLDLSYCTQVTGIGLTALGQSCPSLTRLKLSYCNQITDSDLTALVQACPGLTSLDLSRCTRITDMSVIALAQSCSGLTRLKLSYCNQITDRGVAAVIQGCSGLANLRLTSCDRITVRGLNILQASNPGIIIF